MVLAVWGIGKCPGHLARRREKCTIQKWRTYHGAQHFPEAQISIWLYHWPLRSRSTVKEYFWGGRHEGVAEMRDK